jgi:hypothetical protein
MKSMMIKKESWTQKAASTLEQYQEKFTKDTKGTISKEMAIIRILEEYGDANKLKEDTK